MLLLYCLMHISSMYSYCNMFPYLNLMFLILDTAHLYERMLTFGNKYKLIR